MSLLLLLHTTTTSYKLSSRTDMVTSAMHHSLQDSLSKGWFWQCTICFRKYCLLCHRVSQYEGQKDSLVNPVCNSVNKQPNAFILCNRTLSVPSLRMWHAVAFLLAGPGGGDLTGFCRDIRLFVILISHTIHLTCFLPVSLSAPAGCTTCLGCSYEPSTRN